MVPDGDGGASGRSLDLPIDRFDDVVDREQNKEISAKRERLRAAGHVRRW